MTKNPPKTRTRNPPRKMTLREMKKEARKEGAEIDPIVVRPPGKNGGEIVRIVGKKEKNGGETGLIVGKIGESVGATDLTVGKEGDGRDHVAVGEERREGGAEMRGGKGRSAGKSGGRGKGVLNNSIFCL